MERILEMVGAKVDIQEGKKLRSEGDKEGVLVKLGNEGQKREVMEKKSKLRGRKEKIMEDWTWKESKMKWKLEEIARMEEGKGKIVWRGYGKLRIDGQW